ncbi:chorismate mutase [Streptomyces sp. NPDC020681]|uniref:chorismate mutase n=1 Tax=Streptomyces sp. NPDC020681 TaxID=3365083 RepID=UPI0037983795
MTVSTGTTGAEEAGARVAPEASDAVRGPAPMTGQPAEQTIAEARRCIDDLDDAIIRLIWNRMLVSAQVQRARLASGGRRLCLTREGEILDRYNDALGKQGIAVATSLLQLCRGRDYIRPPVS